MARNVIKIENTNKGKTKAKQETEVSIEAQERLAEILNDSPRVASLAGTEWEIRTLRQKVQWMIAAEVIKINKLESATYGDVVKQFAENMPSVVKVITLAVLNDRNKIFKNELFVNLRFPIQKRRFEDMWMIGEILRRNPVIATTSQGAYKYYWNPNGLMASMDSYSELIKAQMDIVQKHGINIRDRRWHKLYMDMYNIQLYVYIQSGEILIPSLKVVPNTYGGFQGLVKSLALDLLGLKCSCKLFKMFFYHVKKGK